MKDVIAQFAVAVALLAVSPAESQAAFAHRATLPPDVAAYTWYLSLSDVPAEQQFKLQAALEYVVPSLCHKPYLPPQIPVKIEGQPLLAINTVELGWAGFFEKGIQRHYPYRPDITSTHHVPIVVSGLWFLTQATDPNETPGFYYDLLYSGKPPKTADEYLAFWQTQKQTAFFLGLLEGNSGVAVQRHRTLENRPTANRGFMWLTKDSRRLDAKHDPLENIIPGQVKFDASEYIGAIPKYTSGRSGALFSFFLADAKGNRQERAPADVVADTQQTRTVEIRNFVSCIGCHSGGINAPSVDEYREYLLAGARIHAYDRATKEQIEAYLEGDLGKEIRRNNEDFAAGVDMACGYPPEVVSGFYTAMVRAYDADVTLEQAARELGSDPRELGLAIAWANENYVTLSARLAQLPHGKSLPRDRWEQESFNAYVYLQKWRAK